MGWDDLPKKPSTFEEFWPYYVSEHAHPMNRRLHFIGTSLAFIFLASAAMLEMPVLLIGAVISGYAFAWFGHFFVEHNRPATFKAPGWSLLGDFKMFHLTLNRKMDAEIERLGLKKTNEP